jgi:hypothetical protein
MDKYSLYFFGTIYILNYIKFHPVEWSDLESSRRGGVGDQAGPTPTPAVREFLALLEQKGDLFTQREFEEHCIHEWSDWFYVQTANEQRGVRAKLRNNFYPSMIDTLYVYALLIEERVGDVYLVSPELDARDKIDLIVRVTGLTVGLALVGPTEEADQDRNYKTQHRPGIADGEVIVVKLPNNRPKSPGNKRWFQIEDFAVLFNFIEHATWEDDGGIRN